MSAVAQLVEWLAWGRAVTGSSLTGGTAAYSVLRLEQDTLFSGQLGIYY